MVADSTFVANRVDRTHKSVPAAPRANLADWHIRFGSVVHAWIEAQIFGEIGLVIYASQRLKHKGGTCQARLLDKGSQCRQSRQRRLLRTGASISRIRVVTARERRKPRRSDCGSISRVVAAGNCGERSNVSDC